MKFKIESEPLSGWWRVVLSALVIATAAVAIHGLTPPRALDESAPADQFSAARAKAHLQQIAREPHSIGTPENGRVRDYLVQQLTALGGEVQVERTTGITGYERVISFGRAANVFATFRGRRGSGRAVMLTSHYDSVPEGPGAADAGSGVATILEVLRALKTGAPLQNDLLILITDGEEAGLIGAAGFVQDHPLIAQRVGVVLNFEARGSSGPALMFETSEGNGWLAREFARAAPYPMGSSLAYAVYQRLPNNTDMTVFKKAGLTGLNFAFSGTFENYHTRRDTAENLDVHSLQQLGSNALALTRHFGNLPLGDERPPNRVFFDWYGSGLVHYQPWVVWTMLVLVGGLFAAVARILTRRGLVAPWRVLGGVAASLLVILSSIAGASAAWW
ncbi:MAG: M20/M25/M40 family metallo-hydrolase, partial [Verrucomicrobiota bacterium]|nr:M20/M25/M40 family metallo-hydrolase [Verrucomicrobiota bacterium]